MNPETKQKLVPAAAIALTLMAVGWFLSPIFQHPDALINDDPFRYHDYLQQATYDHLFRTSILDHGQFALRTHLLGGGYPLIANPQDCSFSPFSLTPLLMGVPVGMKVNILLFFLIGAGGMLVLVRKGFAQSWTAAIFAALAYTFCAWWASRVEWGFYFKLYFHFVPLIFFFYMQAKKRPMNLLWAGILMTIVISQLGLGVVVIFLFLGCFDLIDYLSTVRRFRRPAFLGRILVLALIVLCLGAVRIFPMANLIQDNPREVGEYSAYTEVPHAFPTFYQGLHHFGYALTHYDPTPNFPIHPGWGVLMMALVGVVVTFRRSWKLTTVTLLFVIFAFGPYSPVDLWRPLFNLPMFSSMNYPYQLTNYFILFGLCILAGHGFSLIEKAGKKKVVFALSLLPFLVLVQPIIDNRPVYEKTFTKSAPELPIEDEFFQVKGHNQNRGAPRTLHSHQYFNVTRNVGTIDWDGDVLLDENAIPKELFDHNDNRIESPEYRGEVWVESGDAVTLLWDITPNQIFVRAKVQHPDWVVINQNFDPAWKLVDVDRTLKVEPSNGVMRIRLESAGLYEIPLFYLPTDFFVGLTISTFSWLGLMVFGVLRLRKQRRNPSTKK